MVKLFLSSSNYLKDDREKFAVFTTRLNEHYESNGYC